MKVVKRRGWISMAILLGLTVLVVGCGQQEKRGDTVEASAEDKQLYSCGMHPNVIQEGPGNCPICGMKLTPIGGVSASSAGVPSTPSEESGEKKILYWRAPMDPSYISPKPGKSPMGMDLIPVYEGEEAFGATVKINPVVEQNMGIRVATVERRNLYQKIRTIGRIDYDESKVAHVHTKITGWIEKTYVSTTGENVERGQLLLDIYSPQLVSAQEEYLDAIQNLRALGSSISESAGKNLRSIISSSRRRLEYFDISEDQIEQLATTGVVRKTMTIQSPFNGIVVEKHALDGMEVKAGMMLYLIADLSEIWVYADIYEYEVPWVKEGQTATMTLSYDPGRKYRGKVQYIYPYLEEKTRTIRVRLVFPNPNLDLKPGMYANVDIETSPQANVLAVPMEAVLFSGERNLVIVSLGKGRFSPRDVTIGIESGDGYYEVKEGLSEGEVVVSSGQFLLDSESKLQETIAKLLAIEKGEPPADEITQEKEDRGPGNKQQMDEHEMKEGETHGEEVTPEHKHETGMDAQ